ncbi:MAG: hypothetical protein FWD31_13970, partial [Planctomycetaceae bacterium]|nr:hypothetical protein [Planctomycetaceae bacterium]
MTAYDIGMTDGAIAINHKRVYDNLGGFPDGPNGYGWKTMVMPKMFQYMGFWRAEFDDWNSVHFQPTPSVGVYAAQFGYPDTLQINTIDKTLVVTRGDNSVWTFNNDPSRNMPVGAIMMIVKADGNVSEFVYNFSKQLEKIRAWHNSLSTKILAELKYTWDSANRITSIVLEKYIGTAPKIYKRVTYTYHTGSDTFGNAGDLKTVIGETANGASWVRTSSFHYRYYKTGDPKGTVHALKMAFFPDDFEYFASACGGTTACLAVADATALNYSTKYYEYDVSNRVTQEKVDRNSKTITFAYTVYPDTTNLNAVVRKTVETGPQGEQNI